MRKISWCSTWLAVAAQVGNGVLCSCLHVYKNIWRVVIIEVLECIREPTNRTLNRTNRYTVAIINNEVVIGHLPKRNSKVCSLFLRIGDLIGCAVTGTRHHFTDLHTQTLDQGSKLITKFLFVVKFDSSRILSLTDVSNNIFWPQKANYSIPYLNEIL